MGKRGGQGIERGLEASSSLIRNCPVLHLSAAAKKRDQNWGRGGKEVAEAAVKLKSEEYSTNLPLYYLSNEECSHSVPEAWGSVHARGKM